MFPAFPYFTKFVSDFELFALLRVSHEFHNPVPRAPVNLSQQIVTVLDQFFPVQNRSFLMFRDLRVEFLIVLKYTPVIKEIFINETTQN